MASKAHGGGMKPQDDALQILRRVQGDLENLSSGTAYWDAGRPAGTGIYPIDYQAKAIPPVYEDIQIASGLLGQPPQITVEVTDEDRRVMKEKLDIKDVALLHKRFFETYKPMSDPIRYWTLRKIWPEPFEAMERAIEKRADMQKDIQKKMLGEPSKETLIMLMALQDSSRAAAALSSPIGPAPVNATENMEDEGLLSGLVSDTQMQYVRGLAAVSNFWTRDPEDRQEYAAAHLAAPERSLLGPPFGQIYAGMPGNVQREETAPSHRPLYPGTKKDRKPAEKMGGKLQE